MWYICMEQEAPSIALLCKLCDLLHRGQGRVDFGGAGGGVVCERGGKEKARGFSSTGNGFAVWAQGTCPRPEYHTTCK
jgi:hypothetical protein